MTRIPDERKQHDASVAARSYAGNSGIGRKRSLSIAGHRTSISLEEPFWDGLRSIADTTGCSLAALVASIDAERGPANLSSALRVRVLMHFKTLGESAAENR